MSSPHSLAPVTFQRSSYPQTLGGLLAWLFMRLSGLLLLGMALFHLFYMQFVIPGGVAFITYQVIVDRWQDPIWGIGWRLFDLTLLLLSMTHGSVGLLRLINQRLATRFITRRLAQLALAILYLTLLTVGSAAVILLKS